MKREPSRETLSRPGKPRWPAARSGPRQPTVAAASAAIACLIFVTVRRQLDCAQPEKRADPAAGTPWPRPHPARSAVLLGLTWSNRGSRTPQGRHDRTTGSEATTYPARGGPPAYRSGGYREPPTRRAVTVGNEVPPADLASKVPDGSDPPTLAWPLRCPAALRRRHRHPAAQRS